SLAARCWAGTPMRGSPRCSARTRRRCRRSSRPARSPRSRRSRAFPATRWQRTENAMNVHEYQGKQILRQYGVATPKGIACLSVAEAESAAQAVGGKLWVVKAQIHAGGRGKGGGVKVARSLAEVREHAQRILGMRLVTH